MLGVAGCSTVAPSHTATVDPSAATFLLVANAETSGDTSEDPPLSAKGLARAAALAEALRDVPLAAIYTDEFRRTQQTAAPVAARHPDAERIRYFSRGPATDSARQWRAARADGAVLVVAQPGTLAPLADALCACTVRPLRADETDRLLRIHLRVGAAAQVQDSRYEAPAR